MNQYTVIVESKKIGFYDIKSKNSNYKESMRFYDAAKICMSLKTIYSDYEIENEVSEEVYNEIVNLSKIYIPEYVSPFSEIDVSNIVHWLQHSKKIFINFHPHCFKDDQFWHFSVVGNNINFVSKEVLPYKICFRRAALCAIIHCFKNP